LVFADPQAKRKKPKEPILCPRSDRPTMNRTKCILKNEINKIKILSWLDNFRRT